MLFSAAREPERLRRAFKAIVGRIFGARAANLEINGD
jgi:hypothetical protein